MEENLMPLGEKLRRVMRRWVTGVAVVTSSLGDHRHGMTVNSFVSISLDPPLVSVTMNNDTRTYAMVMQSGIFAVTILARDQEDVARRFAGRTSDGEDRFAGQPMFLLSTGAPLLQGGAAFLDCKVVHRNEMHHSTLIVGEVLAAQLPAGELVPPLVYSNRAFTGL